MRGDDRNDVNLFSYISPEARVPKDHPLYTTWTSPEWKLTGFQGKVRRLE